MAERQSGAISGSILVIDDEQSMRELLPKILPLFRPHRRFLFAAYGLLVLAVQIASARPRLRRAARRWIG